MVVQEGVKASLRIFLGQILSPLRNLLTYQVLREERSRGVFLLLLLILLLLFLLLCEAEPQSHLPLMMIDGSNHKSIPPPP